LRWRASDVPARNCVILVGTELSFRGAAQPASRFVNVYAKSDTVIDVLANKFTLDGGGSGAMGNGGMTLGLRPRLVPARRQPSPGLRHQFSHEWDGNWPLYCTVLAGDDLSGLPEGPRSARLRAS
jgi:hypothetical protein